MESMPQLVTEGFLLHLKIESLKEKLRTIEATLKSEALRHRSDHVPLKSKKSGGSQWIALGEGCEARVVVPDSRIKESFPWEGKEISQIKALCSDHFERLFEPEWSFSPVHQFRRKTNELLGSDAEKLLKICTRTTSPKILWRET